MGETKNKAIRVYVHNGQYHTISNTIYNYRTTQQLLLKRSISGKFEK